MTIKIIKGGKMSDIKLFKLSNGEEIVARKKEEKLETL